MPDVWLIDRTYKKLDKIAKEKDVPVVGLANMLLILALKDIPLVDEAAAVAESAAFVYGEETHDGSREGKSDS